MRSLFPTSPSGGVLNGALLMIASGAGFAYMAVCVRILGREGLDPFQVAFLRNAFGLLAMLPWALRTGRGALRTRRLGLHLLRAVVGVTAMVLLFFAMTLMPLAEASALTFLAPVFATVGAALLLGETVRLRRWAAVAVGFGGAMLILRPGIETVQPAALTAVAAALFMALAVLCVKSLSRTESSNTAVLYMSLLMTPLSLLPALLVWQWPTPGQWMLGLAMGLVATVGQQLLVRAMAAADASLVMPFDFARLVFIALGAYLLFGEVPDLWTWAGAGVILGSAAYIAHRESRLHREDRT